MCVADMNNPKRYRGRCRRTDGLRGDKLKTLTCAHFSETGWCPHGQSCGFLHIFYDGPTPDTPFIDAFVSHSPPAYSDELALCRPCDDSYQMKVRRLGMFTHNPYFACYRVYVF